MAYELDKRGFSHGDLLVFKGFVDHWAVYAGRDRIIHYNKRPKDEEATILEESINDYWRYSSQSGSISSASTFNSSGSSSGSNCSYYCSSFCTIKRYPQKEPSLGLVERKLYDEYSPATIVTRARRYIGKANYNLIFNNCETFAKWCKYGVKMSEQAQKIGLTVSTSGGIGAGAGVGAIIGAGVGSIVPVVGTAVGGFIGGCIGAVTGALGGGGGGWAANQVVRKIRSNEADF